MGLPQLLGPFQALSDCGLEEFANIATESQKQIAIETQGYPPESELPQELIAQQWVADNLVYETSRAIKRKESSIKERWKLEQEALNIQVRTLKKLDSQDEYGDIYNKLVCKKADSLGIGLREAEALVREEIIRDLSSKDMEIALSEKFRIQESKRLRSILKSNLGRLGDIELALKLTALTFELDLRKTDKVWSNKFEKVVLRGLNGETVNFITMLCMINNFDYQGGYSSEPNLFAYKQNQKLEPIPIILNEMNDILSLFQYYGINSCLNIYVADTDYTEIEQYGPVKQQNLINIKNYINNLREYVQTLSSNISVSPISELTDKSTLYQEVKKRVLDNLATFKDQNFARKWYGRFEEALEKISESQNKKKLFPKKVLRQKCLEIARKLWAVNAAQGAVFGTLGENTILMSTERRERDTNYIIDDESTRNFPSVIYVLSAAEKWYRNLSSNPSGDNIDE